MQCIIRPRQRQKYPPARFGKHHAVADHGLDCSRRRRVSIHAQHIQTFKCNLNCVIGRVEQQMQFADVCQQRRRQTHIRARPSSGGSMSGLHRGQRFVI